MACFVKQNSLAADKYTIVIRHYVLFQVEIDIKNGHADTLMWRQVTPYWKKGGHNAVLVPDSAVRIYVYVMDIWDVQLVLEQVGDD